MSDKNKREAFKDNTTIHMGEFIFLGLTIMCTLIYIDYAKREGINTDIYHYLEYIGLGGYAFAQRFKPIPLTFQIERTEFPIEYTVRGDPAIVFNTDRVSFDGYIQYLENKAYLNLTETSDMESVIFDRAKVRETLYNYIYLNLFMYNRHGPRDENFIASWHHYKMVVIQKTLKDMIIQLDKQQFRLEEIKKLFFDVPNEHFYVLKHPQ